MEDLLNQQASVKLKRTVINLTTSEPRFLALENPQRSASKPTRTTIKFWKVFGDSIIMNIIMNIMIFIPCCLLAVVIMAALDFICSIAFENFFKDDFSETFMIAGINGIIAAIALGYIFFKMGMFS